jgi:hypothetical protein
MTVSTSGVQIQGTGRSLFRGAASITLNNQGFSASNFFWYKRYWW